MAEIHIFSDTRGFSQCKSCFAEIEWATVVGSERKMPFDPPIVAVRTYHDPARRLIEVVDPTVSKSHFSSCPQSDQWRRKK